MYVAAAWFVVLRLIGTCPAHVPEIAAHGRELSQVQERCMEIDGSVSGSEEMCNQLRESATLAFLHC